MPPLHAAVDGGQCVRRCAVSCPQVVCLIFNKYIFPRKRRTRSLVGRGKFATYLALVSRSLFVCILLYTKKLSSGLIGRLAYFNAVLSC